MIESFPHRVVAMTLLAVLSCFITTLRAEPTATPTTESSRSSRATTP